MRIRILAQWLFTALELQDQDTVGTRATAAVTATAAATATATAAGNLAQTTATATQHAISIPAVMLGDPNALGNAPWWPSASVTPLGKNGTATLALQHGQAQ